MVGTWTDVFPLFVEEKTEVFDPPYNEAEEELKFDIICAILSWENDGAVWFFTIVWPVALNFWELITLVRCSCWLVTADCSKDGYGGGGVVWKLFVALLTPVVRFNEVAELEEHEDPGRVNTLEYGGGGFLLVVFRLDLEVVDEAGEGMLEEETLAGDAE